MQHCEIYSRNFETISFLFLLKRYPVVSGKAELSEEREALCFMLTFPLIQYVPGVSISAYSGESVGQQDLINPLSGAIQCMYPKLREYNAHVPVDWVSLLSPLSPRNRRKCLFPFHTMSRGETPKQDLRWECRDPSCQYVLPEPVYSIGWCHLELPHMIPVTQRCYRAGW